MKIISKAFGEYQTNCYIVKTNMGELIIDPGLGSKNWVKLNCQKPLAILCTHGHFDHIFDVASLKKELNIPVYIHNDDAFMLIDGYQFGFKFDGCEPDFKISEGIYNVNGVEFEFMHFPGHTPGCCMIRVGQAIFSGDFLFCGSIGRWDFEYSNKEDMLKSLEKCQKITKDYPIYPGHGPTSRLKIEQENLPIWSQYVKRGV